MVRLILILIVAAAALAGCSPRERELADVNTTSCEVYRSFYAHLPERKAVFFRSTTLPLPPIAGDVPTNFERDTGAWETIEADGVAGSIEFPIREDFSLDTSAYSGALRSSSSPSLASCFSEDGPPFHDGSFDLLHLRENLLDRDDDGLVTV